MSYFCGSLMNILEDDYKTMDVVIILIYQLRINVLCRRLSVLIGIMRQASNLLKPITSEIIYKSKHCEMLPMKYLPYRFQSISLYSKETLTLSVTYLVFVISHTSLHTTILVPIHLQSRESTNSIHIWYKTQERLIQMYLILELLFNLIRLKYTTMFTSLIIQQCNKLVFGVCQLISPAVNAVNPAAITLINSRP